MSLYLTPKDRNLVPFWRPARVATSLGERDGGSVPKPVVLVDPHLEERIESWHRNLHPVYAAEAIGAALTGGNVNAAIRVADELLTGGSTDTYPMLGHLAHALTGREPDEDLTPGLAIRALRQQIRVYSRSPSVWIDAALAYANIGNIEKARRCAETAVALAPNDRFIVRSAARFFLHAGEPDRAAFLLQRTPATMHDPWLVAADLAVARVMSRSPDLLKVARSIIASESYDAFDISELASQLGTIYLEDGHGPRARKMLALSMQKPTGNSAAQVTWLVTNRQIEIDTTKLRAERPYEAQTWDNYFHGKWDAALEHARKWHGDEPFASRPAVLGSHIAGLMENYRVARDIAEQGRRANPAETSILNNVAFYEAQLGNIEAAQKIMDQIPVDKLEGIAKVAPLATQGLLCFRRGDVVRGQALYARAISFAGSDLRLKQVATIHFLYEELRAKIPAAYTAAHKVISEIGNPADAAMRTYIEQLQRLLNDRLAPSHLIKTQTRRSRQGPE